MISLSYHRELSIKGSHTVPLVVRLIHDARYSVPFTTAYSLPNAYETSQVAVKEPSLFDI